MISVNSVCRLPGSVLFACASAFEAALSHELVDSRMQVSMIEEKPTSLPPIVI